MPLLKFHLQEGWSRDETAMMLDVAHATMVRSFDVPERDRYQLVNRHAAGDLIAEDTGLGMPRTERFILLEVVSRPRPLEQKQMFYANLCEELSGKCGVVPTDIMICFVENSDADWSFGSGRAQFLTGEL